MEKRQNILQWLVRGPKKFQKERKSESHNLMFSPMKFRNNEIKINYSADTYAYGAMELIVADIIRANWLVRDLNKVRVSREKASALYRLIEFPNPDFTWTDLISYEAKDLLSNGNSFMEIATNGKKKEPTLELYRLMPGDMSIVISKKNYIEYYKYRVNGKVIPLPKENVIFMRLANSNTEILGSGPLEAAAKEIMLRGWSRVYLSSFFKNGAVLSAVIVTKYPMNDVEFKKLQAKLEGDYAGAENAFRILLIDSNEIDKVDLSTNIKDLPIKDLDENLKHAILTAFRTPDALLGMTQAATKASAVAISTNFWHSVVVPYLTLIRDSMNLRLAHFYPDYRLDFDITKVPEIQGYQADVSEKISRLVLNSVMDTNEGRDIAGLSPRKENYRLSPANENIIEVKDDGNK